MRPSIKNLTFPQLKEYLANLGESTYRFAQITNWLYKKYAVNFDEMSNINKKLRNRLSDDYTVISLMLKERRQEPDVDKFLFTCHDGHNIETVIIRDAKRCTICVSTQIGCPLKCSFCRTGRISFIRNLTVAEIIDQFTLVNRTLQPEEKITNLVFMGMGEPLLNYDNVEQSIKVLQHDHGCAFSGRRMTLSTAGIIPGIHKLAEADLNVNLAVSLNAPDNEMRSELMPINRKYPMKDLLESIKDFPVPHRRRVTFEYILIHGKTDGVEAAKKLVKLLKPIKCKVNLIPYNPTENDELVPSTNKQVLEFEEYLWKYHIHTFIRKSKGQSLKAACGQLAAEYLDQKKGE